MSLPRSLSLFGAVMLVVGNVVGAGIFTTSGMLAEEIPGPISMLLVWVAGGLLSIAGALTYAELGAMFPRAGGDYQFLKEAYGKPAGFVLGWLSFWVINPGSIAALSIAIVSYFPGFFVADGSVLQKVLAMAVVVILSFINFRSTRLASSAQSVITVLSIVLLLAFAVGGAVFGEGSSENFLSKTGESFSITSVPGSAMIAVLFTYSGWFAAAYVGSEVKKPGKNVPLALFMGTAMVMLLYTAVNAAYIYAMPLEEMKGATNVARIAAERLFGQGVSLGVSAAIILAIASCINATVMTGARVCYAMADDGLFFSKLKSVHPKYKTPHVAVVAQAACAVALIALGTFDELLTYVVFAMLLSSIATGVSHIMLRVRRPDIERSYKTFGYPITPIVFIAAYGAIAVSIAWSNLSASLVGMGLAITGIPFYYIWKSRRS